VSPLVNNVSAIPARREGRTRAAAIAVCAAWYLSRVPLRPPLRLLRLGNPLVRGILRSPAHRLLSRSLIVLEYEGRTSGRAFAIPVRYAQTENARLVALAVDRAGKRWWRAFVEPRRAVVVHRGSRQVVVGTLAEGSLREEARATYVARYPRSAPFVEDAALVVFERSG